MDEHIHHRATDEFAIPELCEEHFLTRTDLIKIVWTLGVILVGACTAAITYGLTNNTNIATLQTTVQEQKDQISEVKGENIIIISKLDKILAKITK